MGVAAIRRARWVNRSLTVPGMSILFEAAARRNPLGATSTAGEWGAADPLLASMTVMGRPPSRTETPRYADRPSRLAAKGMPWTMYRLNSRRGSWNSRCTHSMPNRCIHAGARWTCPVRKLKLTPTPSHHAAGSDGRSLAISCSCLGDPRATKTMSGLAAASTWAISAISLGRFSNPNCGQ